MQIFILLLGIIFTLVSVSAYGEILSFNRMMLYMSVMAIIVYVINKHKNTLRLNGRGYIVSLICIFEAINICCNYVDYVQWLEFCTVFGLLIGVNLLCYIKWENIKYLKSGLFVAIISIYLIFLFLPDNLFEGWNDNSAIILIPVLFVGLCLLYSSNYKYSAELTIALGMISLYPIIKLENRSALVTVILFIFISIPIIYKYFCKKHIYKIVCISALLLNVIVPYFRDAISDTQIFQDMIGVSQDIVSTKDGETVNIKEGGFNNREGLWKATIAAINEKPLLGHAGKRKFYPHNFSLDILYQFGWLGWISFALLYLSLVECCYVEFGNHNIFMAGFSSLLVLNCFENMLFANTYFTIFPYFLFAIPWRLKYVDENRNYMS